ncbi:iron-sulfur cluster co-chaperone protein HscB [Dendropsophus ebraccatus]|uniref:iron-sulfur cluster co-chaperone protein HscB n=1 Tax=Dendropsophus ebraccatus TaxID=150705 RepID=UPI0038319757
MEPAGRVVWGRCAGQWRACSGAAPRVAAVTCLLSRCRAPLPVSGVLARRASVSLCSSAVCPRRALCVGAGSPRCWSCQAGLSGSELFCPSCRSIQPPGEDRDYYRLLDCDRSFNVDIQDLQRKYRNLQRLLHPDYFSQKSQRERDISEKQSSLVNKAYNTLLSPLSRGIYLLSLHGITITEGTEGGADTPFLFEILEINEKLNDMTTEGKIVEIGTFVQDKCQSLTENIRQAFEKGDLDGAKLLLVEMKYYVNILDQVKKKIIP